MNCAAGTANVSILMFKDTKLQLRRMWMEHLLCFFFYSVLFFLTELCLIKSYHFGGNLSF